MVWSWLDVLKAVVILDMRTYLRETESILICFSSKHSVMLMT